jgi:hypothetical protein
MTQTGTPKADDVAPMLEYSGLRILRLGIGAYFTAISVDMIQGVDPGAALALVLPRHDAALIGSVALATCSVLMMAGYRPRLIAAILGLFVMSATLVENLLGPGAPDISAYWRDVTLVFAIVLTYWTEHLTQRARNFLRVSARRPRRTHRPRTPGETPRPRKLMQEVQAESGAQDAASEPAAEVAPSPAPLLVVPESLQASAVWEDEDTSRKSPLKDKAPAADPVDDSAPDPLPDWPSEAPARPALRFRPLPEVLPDDAEDDNIFTDLTAR